MARAAWKCHERSACRSTRSAPCTRIPNAPTAGCHTEHQGEHAALTTMAEFDHHWTNYELTGSTSKLRMAGRAIRARVDNHAWAAHACVSCHADPAVHKGGTNCAQCHSTATFAGATFKHRFRSITAAGVVAAAAARRHQDESNYKTYTCYGCHEHTPAKMGVCTCARIANFQDCALPRRRPKKDRRGAADVDILERWLTSSTE